MNRSISITTIVTTSFVLMAFLFTASFVSAERVPVVNNNSAVSVLIPDHAVQVTENVFSLGNAIDPQTGKKVEGYMIVHPRTAGKKPDGTPGGGKGGNGGGETTTSSCYGFIANNAKWKVTEDWVVDTTITEGLSDASIMEIIDGAITKWEDAADGEADGNVSMTEIFGTGSFGTASPNTSVMDSKNTVRFGALENNGTIAVTTIWGIFGGRPQSRELVEWDQVYNTYYNWATDGNVNAMDFESIATHEIGHSFGMADLYQAECAEETMYGYGANGQTTARDLNVGDITGISELY